MKETPWWVWTAGATAIWMTALALGNLIEDDGGPFYGQLLFAAVLIGGAIAVAGGVRMRSSRPEKGAGLVGFGVIPAVSGMALFWFPPAVAAGVLALATSVAAFRNSRGLPVAGRRVFIGSVIGTAVLTAVSLGLS